MIQRSLFGRLCIAAVALMVVDAGAQRKQEPDDLAIRGVDVQFAFFPENHALHVVVDVTHFKQRERVKGITLSIRKRGTSQVIARTTMPPLANNMSELRRWDVPPLKADAYELVTQPEGFAGKPRVDSFVRYHFAWEGNKLGTSDVLVPPFSPIDVSGNQVSVILRKHYLNGVGLWDQVIAADKPLLKAPMRLEAVIGGKTVTAAGAMRVTDHTDTRAAVHAAWHAGALQGTTEDTWDYDGVMKSVITLEPSTTPIDRLTLVIPLVSARVPLMTAVTFGNKFNYAGYVPAGRGLLWRSSEAPANDYVGTFVPYLWLGGFRRGLAVFADNDAGWIADGQADCQQIVRPTDGTTDLRLQLIQERSQWKTPRQITLGFQATPAKPMPNGWRLWTVSASRTSTAASHANAPGLYQQALFGSTLYWGGIAPSGDIYPADGDLALWREFGRLRKAGKLLGTRDEEFARKWDRVALTRLARINAGRSKFPATAVRAGLVSMATQPQGVLIYTDARAMRCDLPDGQTFLNQWSREAFPRRQWDYATGTDFGVDPVSSFRDSRAWYYKQALSMFADAIYWDCVFLYPNYNPIASDAYERADGKVQPSAGLWNLRALVRRGAVLVEELGKTNRNMVHMSGTEIVPINDFAATQADWELKYGGGDFQDKFPRDYILAQTIGRQAGLMPVVILDQKFIVGNNQEMAWQYRTASGVCLTHELKPWSVRSHWAKPDPFWANYDRLVEFGYGQPGVDVYNYWQQHYPAGISGQSSSLLVSKPGCAILVLCDYGAGGTFAIQLDRKALALAGRLTAVNMETKQSVLVNGNALTVTLKRHDFVVLRIDAQAP